MTRNIMIVGNGELRDGNAAIIDAADVVIRFNDCRSYGFGGMRTDIVAVCNTGRAARELLKTAAWRTHPAVTTASEIWCVRDPVKFAELRGPLILSNPDLEDFCDDYTAGFEEFCAEAGKSCRIICGCIHDRVDREIAMARPEGYIVPSSGAIVIGEVLNNTQDCLVTLAGFDHLGWEGHPFAAERLWVNSLVTSGRLRRLHQEKSSVRHAGRSRSSG